MVCSELPQFPIILFLMSQHGRKRVPAEKIDEAKLPFLGFIINRVLPVVKETPNLKGKIAQALERHQQLVRRDEKQIRQLKKAGGKEALYQSIPLLPEDIHDLSGLKALARYLAEM
mgnify:CR=1 FL=1